MRWMEEEKERSYATQIELKKWNLWRDTWMSFNNIIKFKSNMEEWQNDLRTIISWKITFF